MEIKVVKPKQKRTPFGPTIVISRRDRSIDLPFIAQNYNFEDVDTPEKLLRFLNHLIEKQRMTLKRFTSIMRKTADAVGIPLEPFNPR